MPAPATTRRTRLAAALALAAFALTTLGAIAQPENPVPSMPRRPVVTPSKPVPAAAPGQFAVSIEGVK